jgi:RNA polymerase sigma factor (sigma-70 family)
MICYERNKMGKKNKHLLDYREDEVIRALGVLPLSGKFMPTYFIEDEHSEETINPETINELIERTTAEDIFEENQYKKRINDALDSLTPREAKVLRLRYGFGFDKDLTLEEVGSMFDKTRERIRQVEAKALRKMRHPSRADFFDDTYFSLHDQANEPMPERDMEWGWSVDAEERYQKHVSHWRERVDEALKLLDEARFKLKNPIYKKEEV